jgi:hypothetical protein
MTGGSNKISKKVFKYFDFGQKSTPKKPATLLKNSSLVLKTERLTGYRNSFLAFFARQRREDVRDPIRDLARGPATD